MARNKPAVKTAPTNMWVPATKSSKGEIGVIDALSVPIYTAAEVKASGSTMQGLCLNLLAGRLDADISEAIATKGGIARLFNGSLSDPEVSALKKAVAVTPAALRAAWEGYVSTRQRVRCISLQALAKSLADKPAEKSLSFRDRVLAWASENPEALATLPVALFDIIAEAMPSGDAA